MTARKHLERVSRMNGVATATSADVLLRGDEFTLALVGDVVSGRTAEGRAEALCALLYRYGVGTVVTDRMN